MSAPCSVEARHSKNLPGRSLCKAALMPSARLPISHAVISGEDVWMGKRNRTAPTPRRDARVRSLSGTLQSDRD